MEALHAEHAERVGAPPPPTTLHAPGTSASKELPTDTLSPQSDGVRQIRAALTICASYCKTLSRIGSNQTKIIMNSSHPHIAIVSNDQMITNQLPICFLKSCHVLAHRFLSKSENDTNLVQCIDVTDLNVSDDILDRLFLLMCGTRTEKEKAMHDHTSTLLSTFVGACKLQMVDLMDNLLDLIRTDSGRLDVTELSVSDFTFVLEMASNSRFTAKTALDRLRNACGRKVGRGGRRGRIIATSHEEEDHDSDVNTLETFDLPPESLAKRELILEELIASESKYVQHLTRLVKVYKKRLMVMAESGLSWKTSKNASPVITEQQAETIFGVSSSLHTMHTALLSRLVSSSGGGGGGGGGKSRGRRTSLVVADIGSVLKTFINGSSNQFTNMYQQYTMNYIRSLTTLTKLKQDDNDFSFWLHHFEADEKRQNKNNESSNNTSCSTNNSIKEKELPLESLLIAPVQRVPRYRLFLKDMLKHTTPTHADYEPIKQALVVVEYLCDSINHSLTDIGDDNDDDDHTRKDIAIQMENPLSIIVKSLTNLHAPMGPPPPASDLLNVTKIEK